MNKPELEAEVTRLTKENDKLKKENNYMLKEQKKYVKMAQDAGSELAPFKHMVIRLQEELSKIPSLRKK